MKKYLTACLLLLISACLAGQTPVGSWSDHLVYDRATDITAGSEEVYASTGSSVLIYNKEYGELRKLSRINGLTETGISAIAWSEEYKTLVIGYSTTNIDLLKNKTVSNIPEIYRKYIPGRKEINRIRTFGKYAYLACSFGIVVVDMVRNEIYDSWKPGTGSDVNEVRDIAFSNGMVYAATATGVYSGNLSDKGLAYFGNWDQLNILPDPSGSFTSVVISGNRLYANWSGNAPGGDIVYLFVNGAASRFQYIPGEVNKSLDPAGSGFTITSSGSARYFDGNGSLLKTISSYSSAESITPEMARAITDGNDIWIADLNEGLVKGENMSAFTILALPGPVSNDALNISSLNGTTVICGGSLSSSWNNLWSPLQVSVFSQNSWTDFYSTSVRDAIRSLIDPSDPDHFYVSTWGGGLLEYMDQALVKQYNDSNSPLQTIFPGQPYVRICGLAMDRNGYLWITQTGVPESLKVLKPDGNWIVNPLSIPAPTIGDIIITRTGQKWIILPRGNGLFVFDDNKTPEVFNDDVYRKVTVRDAENNVISYIYSIAEDLEGNIWVGTDQGPVVYYNPEKILTSDMNAFRIKIPRNDGSGLADYLLGTEVITSIRVDGGNRKWLGTLNSGAFLVSPDGTATIRSYNELNSPLFSNSVNSIAVDNKSGDVWFGTAKGVQSVRGDANEAAETFSNIYCFPNPVREDFHGNVTITGLVSDTQIRITDVSGNLVYEAVSEGGMASWNLTTYNGKRVATGVYLVFCASSDGSQSKVVKLLVIR